LGKTTESFEVCMRVAISLFALTVHEALEHCFSVTEISLHVVDVIDYFFFGIELDLVTHRLAPVLL
jgi:hypothetical protein